MWRLEDNFLKSLLPQEVAGPGIRSRLVQPERFYSLSHPCPTPHFSGPCGHCFPFTEIVTYLLCLRDLVLLAASSPHISSSPRHHRLVVYLYTLINTHVWPLYFLPVTGSPSRGPPAHLCILPSAIAPVHHPTTRPLTSHSSSHQSPSIFFLGAIWFPLSNPSHAHRCLLPHLHPRIYPSSLFCHSPVFLSLLLFA